VSVARQAFKPFGRTDYSAVVERPVLKQSNWWVNLERRQESTVPLLDRRIQLPNEVAESRMTLEAGRDDCVGQA